MFQIDTHIHTSETSFCGNISAKDVVRNHKEAGYDGIIITDHYYDHFFERLGDMDWNEKIDHYRKGFHIAKEEGDRLGLKVFFGMELRFQENNNDYLVYGITEEYLRQQPKLYRYTLKEFRKVTEKENFFLVQAHPYRPGLIPMPAELLDAVEGYNGNARHNSRNDLAMAYAKEHGLPVTSGSDYHELEDLGRGGMIFDQEINSIEDYIRAVRSQAGVRLITT